jgi:thioredoxin
MHIRRLCWLLPLLLASCGQENAADKATPGVVILSEANFDRVVLQSKEPVLVDYWAAWCGPCHLLAPAVEELAITRGRALRIGKVNFDDARTLAQRNKVESLPTLILYRDGKEIARQQGVPADDVSAWLRDWVDEELAK